MNDSELHLNRIERTLDSILEAISLLGKEIKENNDRLMVAESARYRDWLSNRIKLFEKGVDIDGSV